MRLIWLLLTLLLVICSCHRQEKNFEQIYAPFLQEETVWADSMLLEMTLDEKIGQLLVLKSTEELNRDSLANWVWNLHIGGWMPEGISLANYKQLTDSLQNIARIPLLMGTAQTIALNNQFTDVIDYPLPATISAIPSRQKKDYLLAQYVEQCKLLNVHFSLAPALQIADTSQIIFDTYALENNPEEQLFRSYTTMHELQKEKVLSIAGPFRELYFASETDEGTKAKRDSLMNRYFNLSQNGLSGLMIDNAVFRADTNRFYPYGFLTEYLQEFASFDGLMFAQPDSMTTALDLLHGGVDVLLIKGEVWQTIAAIRKAVNEGFLTVEQLNTKVRKVLRAKTWLDLDDTRPKLSEEAIADLFAKENHVYPVYELYESALTLANNMDSIVPFTKLDKQSFKLIKLGDPSTRVFEKTFRKYANLSVYRKLTREEDGGWESLNDKSLKKKTIVLTLTNVLLEVDKDEAFIASINELSKSTKLVVVNFGSPFNLRYFSEKVTMVQAYEFNGTTQAQVAQLLFGGLQAKGKLPLALSDLLEQGQGFSNSITRLRYGMPQEVGIAPHKLVDIDAIIYDAIRAKAMPGCQILIVKEGMVIYDKSFGHFTYEKQQSVGGNDLYDIASVTKVAATTIAAMKAYEDGRFKLNQRLSDLLDLDKSKLKGISVKEFLTHRTGLQSYVPITKYLNNRDTFVNGCNDYFCYTQQGDYNLRVGDSLYLNYHHMDSIWNASYDVKRKRRKRYLYSDLNFILLQRAIERRTNSSLDKYVDRKFYKPLNLTRTGFNPIRRFAKTDIVPTAFDEKWRKEQIQGYVHDETATLLGGVAGNAGIFSTASDMAVLFQMLLNKGSYGGEQYLKPETVDLFTKRVRGGRGLGFEVKTKSGTGSCSPYAPNGTYGHKGFTGTCAWVDKENELVYIFLTNRIYPNYKNNRLMRKKVRQRVHSVVYKSLNSYEPIQKEEIDEADKTSVIMANWPEEDCEEEG